MLVSFVRTLILYSLVVLVLRLMGKRQIGQLQPFELVIAIMISELAAVPMQNTGIPLAYGIIPIVTLLAAQITISFISIKSNKGRALICGKPTILIEKGRILEDQFKKEMYTINDLLEQLRINNCPNISDVEYAILETNGQISVIPKSQKRPVTPEDLNIPTGHGGISLDIIMDGEINYKNLAKANRDANWLKAELNKLGIKSVKDVFYASLEPSGYLYCQKKMNSEVG